MWSWTVSLVAFLNFLPRLWQSMRFLDLYWYDRKNKVESPFISNLVKCFFEYCVPFHTACKSILTWLLWVRWKQSAICSPTETFDPRFSNFMPSAGSLVSFCWRDVSTDKYIALGFQTMAAIHIKCKSQGFTHVVNEQWTSWQTRYKVARITLQSWTEKENLQVRHISYWQCSLSWRWVTYLYSHGTSKSAIHMCLFQLLRVRTGKVILVEVLLYVHV